MASAKLGFAPFFSHEEWERKRGLVRFDVNVVANANGHHSFRLCAEGQRHYGAIYPPGQPGKARLSKDFKPCDGSCKKGSWQLVRDPDISWLVHTGIHMLVPANTVLVFVNEGFYHYLEAGNLTSRAEMDKVKFVLGDGQSVCVSRSTRELIDITPAATRYERVGLRRWQDEFTYPQYVGGVIDTIRNEKGRVILDSAEPEFRALHETFESELDARQQEEERAAKVKDDAERKRKGILFARSVGGELRRLRFSQERRDQLFQICGPGAVLSAVDIARWSKKTGEDIYEYAFSDFTDEPRERARRARAFKGADYIVNTGGVPADKR